MNPLSDKPNPRITRAVSRFGLCGIIVSAVCSALSRGWNRLPRWIVYIIITLVGFGVLILLCPSFHNIGLVDK